MYCCVLGEHCCQRNSSGNPYVIIGKTTHKHIEHHPRLVCAGLTSLCESLCFVRVVLQALRPQHHVYHSNRDCKQYMRCRTRLVIDMLTYFSVCSVVLCVSASERAIASASCISLPLRLFTTHYVFLRLQSHTRLTPMHVESCFF
jgi:hypothetical protein